MLYHVSDERIDSICTQRIKGVWKKQLDFNLRSYSIDSLHTIVTMKIASQEEARGISIHFDRMEIALVLVVRGLILVE